MGWWFGKDTQKPHLKPVDSTTDSIPTSSEPPASAEEFTEQPTKFLSKDKQLEQDLERFLHTNEDQRSRRQHDSSQIATTSATDSPVLSPSSTPSDDRTLTPERLYPDTMSCSAAFDRAFYCQSPGGQFTNVYRHGGLKDCAENWSEFWFCMKIRGQREETKQRNIRKFYAEKDAKYKGMPSSEDVWEKRSVMVEKAFDLDPDEVLKS